MPEPAASSGIWAVVPAGGSGSRYSAQEDKLLARLDGIPILGQTLLALLAAPSLEGIVVVSSTQHLKTYQTLVETYAPQAPVHFAVGGATRRASVYNGLKALPDAVNIVAVHDAARPLVRPELVELAIAQVREGACGAILALPIHDTIKQANPGSAHVFPTISATLDRSHLWRAQTPQVFRKSPLLQAHVGIAAGTPVTDDAQLLELAGLGPVVLVPGDERNLKITTPTDLLLAEAFLRAGQPPLL